MGMLSKEQILSEFNYAYSETRGLLQEYPVVWHGIMGHLADNAPNRIDFSTEAGRQEVAELRWYYGEAQTSSAEATTEPTYEVYAKVPLAKGPHADVGLRWAGALLAARSPDEQLRILGTRQNDESILGIVQSQPSTDLSNDGNRSRGYPFAKSSLFASAAYVLTGRITTVCAGQYNASEVQMAALTGTPPDTLVHGIAELGPLNELPSPQTYEHGILVDREAYFARNNIVTPQEVRTALQVQYVTPVRTALDGLKVCLENIQTLVRLDDTPVVNGVSIVD